MTCIEKSEPGSTTSGGQDGLFLRVGDKGVNASPVEKSDTVALVDRLGESLVANDIPPRPAMIDRIRAAMRETAPNFQSVSRMISADVSLAAALLKTANSPYFGLRRRAATINEALMFLGLDVTCRAVAAISLNRAFSGTQKFERFWDASSRIAALSGWLARRIDGLGVRPEDAYTFGLFRDVGIVILLRRHADYAAILACANDDKERSFTAVEREVLPTDHSVVGCLLARNWWLPDEVSLAIRQHHDLGALELAESSSLLGRSRQLVALAQCAEYLLQQATGACHTEEWQKLGPFSLRQLSLEPAVLDALRAEAAALMAVFEA